MNADHPASSAVRMACLALTLAVAALLRFYALPQRGLIYWDEGKFALEGLRLQTALHSLFGSGGAVVAGKAVGTAKPTHALLIALTYALFGVHDYAPLLLNAASSVAQVSLVYLIALRLFGAPTALIAAVFLAVSEYDVIYARSALSESDANLILLSGVLLWTYAIGPYRAGLLMGLAFSTNYRLIVYVGAIAAFDLIWVWREAPRRASTARVPTGTPATGGCPPEDRSPKQHPAASAGGTAVPGPAENTRRRALLWIVGFATIPLVWQLVDLLARARGLVMFRNELTGGPRWYLGEALYQLHEGRQSALHFSPGPYLHWYVLRSGWPMLVLLLAGIALALWRRSFPWLAMAAPVVVPFLVYLFAPFIVPRNLDAALPFAAVLSAAALVSIVAWIWRANNTGYPQRVPGLRSDPRKLGVVPGPYPLVVLIAVTVVLSALGASMAWRLTAERSGYAQAASYVEQHGGWRAVVSSEILVFYLRGRGDHCLAPELRSHIDRLSADVRAGYRYAVLDHYSWKLARLVRSRMPRVVQFSATGSLSVGENLIASENSPQDYEIQSVDVYRLEANRLPPPDEVPADVCSRERV